MSLKRNETFKDWQGRRESNPILFASKAKVAPSLAPITTELIVGITVLRPLCLPFHHRTYVLEGLEPSRL